MPNTLYAGQVNHIDDIYLPAKELAHFAAGAVMLWRIEASGALLSK